MASNYNLIFPKHASGGRRSSVARSDSEKKGSWQWFLLTREVIGLGPSSILLKERTIYYFHVELGNITIVLISVLLNLRF